jgi:hypothetical protein
LHFRYLNRNLLVLKILDGDPIPQVWYVGSPPWWHVGFPRWPHQWQIQGLHLLICMLPSIHTIGHALTILFFFTMADIFIIDHNFRSVENGKCCHRCKCEYVCSFPVKSSYWTPPLSRQNPSLSHSIPQWSASTLGFREAADGY